VNLQKQFWFFFWQSFGKLRCGDNDAVTQSLIVPAEFQPSQRQ
jgi:hypothetical protein